MPAHSEARYYHFAERFNDIDDIHQEGESYEEANFRDQWTAMDALPEIEINGTTYYVYSTLYAQFRIGVAIPIVVARPGD